MPDLAPFRGVRYADRADLTRVVAPPYDVIDAAERAELAALDPNNAVRLILPAPEGPAPEGPAPEGPAPEGPGPESPDPYAEAARIWAEWRADGTLIVEDRPLLYAYRMEAPLPGGTTHETIGVIGALGLPDDATPGDLLPHERTLPKAKSDRLSLLRATRANFDPIWGLTLASGLDELLADIAPVAHAIDHDGVRHELGLIDAPDSIAAIGALVRSAPIVLADGHHRFETATTYRNEGGGVGADAILALVVELDDATLDVRPFHRLIHGAPPELRTRLAEMWSLREIGDPGPRPVERLLAAMDAETALGLVDRHGAALLVPDERTHGALRAGPRALADVDAARFDATIRPLLGDATLSYRSDATAVTAMVGVGDADAVILLRPVSVAQIRGAADARVLMPEKTTYFAPKPRTGMVMRALDAG